MNLNLNFVKKITKLIKVRYDFLFLDLTRIHRGIIFQSDPSELSVVIKTGFLNFEIGISSWKLTLHNFHFDIFIILPTPR